MSCKISAFSFSSSPDSMNTRGLKLMNTRGITFHTLKDMGDYNIPICDSNKCDGLVPDSVKKFDEDMQNSDVIIFAVPECTGHYSGVFKNAMDWLVVKSYMNNSLGTSYGFSNKPVILMTFSPAKEAGNRHFDMTRELLQKMGAKVIHSFVKNDCWKNLYPNNYKFVEKECNFISAFSNKFEPYDEVEVRQWQNTDDIQKLYDDWNKLWK
jgi:NAD(P)H-dependent FMN reductase